jgi:outer membrane immunogenic protein
VVGTGTEGKLLIPGWTYKVETLYMDLGHLDATDFTMNLSQTSQPPTTGAQIHGGQVTTQTHFTDWILRAGVNYQFH